MKWYIPFPEAISQFQNYLSESIDTARITTEKSIHTVLIGHNVFTFDMPILLRNAGNEFARILQTQNVWFADSLALFKTLIKCKHPP